MKQDSKQVQVDLQDLGYETCGRSENEAEREESTSPGKSASVGAPPSLEPASASGCHWPVPHLMGGGAEGVLWTEGDTGPETDRKLGEVLLRVRLSVNLKFCN